MGIPKLPSIGGFQVEISPKTSTDDQYDGTAAANKKRARNAEKAVTPRDDRDMDPRQLKKEQDERNLQAAKKLKIGDEGHAEIKTVAEQQAKIIRQALDQQLKDAGKK
jgi:hypothetical protein